VQTIIIQRKLLAPTGDRVQEAIGIVFVRCDRDPIELDRFARTVREILVTDNGCVLGALFRQDLAGVVVREGDCVDAVDGREEAANFVIRVTDGR
jgi:hypothetical protein